MVDLQKASLLKRISAFLFDFIVFCIIAVGCAELFSMAFGFNGHLEKVDKIQAEYEEKYNINVNISNEEYVALSDEDRARYEEASKAFAEDREVTRLYTLLLSMAMTVTSLSILVSCLLTELVMPLILKNGQTLGKKIFGIALMRVDGVKITAFQVFVRAVLGKYTIETMIPVFLLMLVLFGVIGTIGLLIIALILLIQVILLIVTKTRSVIHDLLSMTVAVDMLSQMIFDSPEELIEFKKKLHADDVAKSEY